MFVFDITGSMRYAINNVKDQSLKLVDEIKNEYPDSTFRVGFAGYRDRYDHQHNLTFEFTDDITDFKSFMTDSVRATG